MIGYLGSLTAVVSGVDTGDVFAADDAAEAGLVASGLGGGK